MATKVIKATASERIITQHGTADLTNSSSATTLFTHSIDAGAIGDNQEVNLEVRFGMNSSFTPPNFSLAVNFGSTTINVLSSAVVAASLTAAPFTLRFIITNVGVTSAQQLLCYLVQDGVQVFTGKNSNVLVTSTSAEDPTTAITLSVVATFASASITTSLNTNSISLKIQ